MKKSQKGFATIPLIIAIVAVLAIAGGVYFYETKTKSPTDTNVQSQNNPSSNISNPTPVTASSASCGDFGALSDYVLKNIQKPDSQNTMQMNPNVITSIRWKRSSNEPFVSYPIINGVQAFYGNQETNRTHESIVSAIKNDSDTLGQTINAKTKNLGLSADPLNTSPFQTFSNQDIYLRTFAFLGGGNLYSIVLKVEGGGHQAPPQGVVTVTCGKAVNQYDKVYNALNFKADNTVQDTYDNDYVAIADVSSDKMVYALLGSSNHIKIADYYYFNGTAAKLVSKDSYPAQCATLESQKVGQGMRCADQNYNQRTVDYSSASNGSVGASTITVLSPNGGEAVKSGGTVSIKWNSTGLTSQDKVYISITDYNTPHFDTTTINAGDTLANQGQYNWAIPSNYKVGSMYKISVYTANQKYIDSSDNYFTISSIPTSSSELNSFTHYDSGITFKYPKDWKFDATKNYFTTSDYQEGKNGARIEFIYGLSGNDWQGTVAAMYGSKSVNTPTSINGKSALRTTYPSDEHFIALSLPFVNNTAFVSLLLRYEAPGRLVASYKDSYEPVLQSIAENAVLPSGVASVWHTYVNNTYNFSFSHPPLTSVISDGTYSKNSVASYLAVVRYGFHQLLFVFTKPAEQSLKAWYDSSFTGMSPIRGPVEKTINGYSAIDVTFDIMAGTERHIIIGKNGVVIDFLLSGYVVDSPLPSDQQKLLDSFLFR